MYASWRSVETYIVKVAQDRTIPRADLVELVAQRGQGPAFDILLRQRCRLLAIPRHSEGWASTSAYPPTSDIPGEAGNVSS